MKTLATKLFVLLFLLGATPLILGQQKTFDVDSFDEVIISPHIEVVFEKSDRESVVIEDIDVSMDKLNVEVKGGTLHIYLDDAKVYTKSEKIKNDDYKSKQAIYQGTKVTATVYYKELVELSLRGEEKHQVISPVETSKLVLKIYGEGEVYLKEVDVNELNTTMYGEAYLEIKEGNANRQKVISYGEGEVNTFGVQNATAKVTAYGEGKVKLKVSDELKVTAYGEASIHYKGSPMVNRGLVLGEATIHQIN
ncbi:head GIN domain-containing protein [Lutimonas zeaxanthinifaciens]|uniref:head GIN domain-containing protein n=1 Tax=Lutimonas zeaxanthinifaciens TaxID=3060215 RepID=UPI00265C9BB1|nr:head GIN domain-containing protein [Lutimonas sp. YSD2104]WKK65108.1 head GIN domain-containing protein [Lutimonas sp. YSD2104]